MGRLYTFEQIANGHVLQREVFRKARSLFGEMSQDLEDKGIIVGSLIYGSVAVDTMGPRSDFDAVTSLREESIESRLAVRAIKLEMLSQFGDGFVEVFDNTVKPQINFKNGNHDFSRFLGQHLSSDDRIVIGTDLATYIKWSGNEIAAVEHLRSYLSNKERRMAKTFEETNPLDLSHGGLQRMLELSCAVGRRALQVTAEIDESSESPIRSVDKQLVTAMARDLFEKYDLVDGFDMLSNYNQTYSEILTLAVNGEVTQSEYEDFIYELHSKLPDVIDWINRIYTNLPILN